MSAEQPESTPPPTAVERQPSGAELDRRSPSDDSSADPSRTPTVGSADPTAGSADASDPTAGSADASDAVDAAAAAARKRRRGSRGGKNRRRPAKPGDPAGVAGGGSAGGEGDAFFEGDALGDQPELPDPPYEGQVRGEAVASDALDDVLTDSAVDALTDEAFEDSSQNRFESPETRVRPRRNAVAADSRPSRPRGQRGPAAPSTSGDNAAEGVESASRQARSGAAERGGRGGGRGRRGRSGSIEPNRSAEPARDAPRDKNGRPVGRYLMCVHTQPGATQIAVLEGRSLIEHYISRPTDQAAQIHGNLYLGRVQNVLPGMEAAFIDIGTPKNAVLYRSDVSVDLGDLEGGTKGAKKRQNDSRIEDILRNSQLIVCQVTKNPIGAKGARLTQEVSLPGRFVVLIPNSDTYGISKRLGDEERKRLRKILDDVRPEGHGLIVRTAAEGATAEELRADVDELGRLWSEIEAKAKRSKGPTLLHREPDLAVRVIREEFNRNYRGVVLDDPELYREVRDYVERITPELADRVEFYDAEAEGLPLYERHHVHEQLHKAIDRKVWLPSGGSLIIERTEALTVIDVNTGKNVGSSNLEETVFRNNLEAAEEIARQLRLRDIGGIIVIDFIDMEIRANRDAVITSFRGALSRDKTRSQVFEISELGLVEMTRKRISEGLVESLSGTCPTCGGRGITFDQDLLH